MLDKADSARCSFAFQAAVQLALLAFTEEVLVYDRRERTAQAIRVEISQWLTLLNMFIELLLHIPYASELCGAKENEEMLIHKHLNGLAGFILRQDTLKGVSFNLVPRVRLAPPVEQRLACASFTLHQILGSLYEGDVGASGNLCDKLSHKFKVGSQRAAWGGLQKHALA